MHTITSEHFNSLFLYVDKTTQSKELFLRILLPKYILLSPFFQARDNSVKKADGFSSCDKRTRRKGKAGKISGNSPWPAQ